MRLGQRPVRVRLRYAAFETFIEKFAPNVTRGGVFLASRTPFPVGTAFPFEIQLAGGEVALAGEGKVTWVKSFDPAAPQKAHGMGVQFLSLDAPSRETLNRMLERKAAGAAGIVRATLGGAASVGHRSGSNSGSRVRVRTRTSIWRRARHRRGAPRRLSTDSTDLRRGGSEQQRWTSWMRCSNRTRSSEVAADARDRLVGVGDEGPAR